MTLRNKIKAVLCTAVAALGFSAAASGQTIKISQVYGGGGNASAPFNADFVELFNAGTTTATLTNWSVQYASSAGTSWAKVDINASIPAGKYFLVQMSTAGATGAALPTPDATATPQIAMSATNGKVALVNNNTLLTGSGCPLPQTQIVDFVGFGSANCAEGTATAALSNTTGVIRAGGGCTDAGNNAADFGTPVTPAPRNSSTAAAPCGGAPTSGACCNGTTCTIALETACTTGGGTFNGATSCTPNPCDPSGSCCIGANCSIAASAAECSTFGGSGFVQGGACIPDPCAAPTEQVVISQIYGGGGNAGATFNADFVELFNRGSSSVTVSNWSLQYASDTGSSWTVSVLGATSFSIPAGGYVLVQLGTSNSAIGAALPTPVITGAATNIGAASGKLALVKGTTSLTGTNPSTGPTIVDFVGFGTNANGSEGSPTTAIPTATSGATNAFFRKGNGCVDTNSNSADFIANPATPTPRTSATPANLCGSATTGACCITGNCTLTTSAGCAGTFNGLGSTCTPTPCVAPQGSCCISTACTITDQAGCTGTWTFGNTCTPNICAGSCCNGTTCTITDAAGCVAPSFYRAGFACGPTDCPSAVAFQAGDIAYGANVAGNADALWQIRSGSRVGTLTGLNFAQSVRFDNANGLVHNARGNLLSANFGVTATGGILQNFATNGTQGAQAFALFNGAGSPVLPLTRISSLSVSPDNSKLALWGNDVRQLMVLDYSAGATIGTGAGASITGINTTPAPATTPTATDFVVTSSNGNGTGFLDNTTVFVFANNANAAYAPGSGSIPVVANVPALFTVSIGSGGALGTPIARWQPLAADDVDNSSRFLSASYSPSISPYIYLLSSSFVTTGNVSKTRLYVIDPATWTQVQTVLLPAPPLDPAPFAGINTGREVAVAGSGASKKLYISAFVGASGNPAVLDTTPAIYSVDVDGTNQLTAASLTSVVARGAATSASFNGLDVALTQPGAATVVCCLPGNNCSSTISASTCTSSGGTVQVGATSCTPGLCTPSLTVCCRGTICSTVAAGSCTAPAGVGVSTPSGSGCNVSGNNTAPCCVADFDKNGSRTIDDIFIFLNAWFAPASNPFTKIGGNGIANANIDDIFIFLNVWFAAGCG